MKNTIDDLAIVNGSPVFASVRPTSNFVQQEPEQFFKYAKSIYENHQITNNGPLVQMLEKRLAEIHQVEQCVAVCSGFMGLVLVMKCVSLPGRHEVVMPSLTYRRMADIAVWAGLTPNFCDVNPQTLGVSSDTVSQCINDNTALILGVHQQVNLCDIDGLVALSSENHIPLIFDAVEAAYASHKGKMVGSFGVAECFSMHASKFLNGFEGGYITTNDIELATKLKQMRTFGFYGQDHIERLGLNAKLNEIHAAMALTNIDDIDAQVERNIARYQKYKELIKSVGGLELLRYDQDGKRAYKNIVVRLNDKWPVSREITLQILHAENILARAYYETPLHTKSTSYETISGSLPVSEKLSQEYMCLPCGQFVSLDDISKIVKILSIISIGGDAIESKLLSEAS